MEEYINTFSTLLNKFYTSLKSDGYVLLDKIVDIDVSIFEKNPLKAIMAKDNMNSYMLLVSLAITGIIIYYSFKLILSLYGDAKLEDIYFFILKLVVIAIISFNSINICKEMIKINSTISDEIGKMLEDVAKDKISYKFVEENIDNLEDFFKATDKISFNGFKDFVVCSYLVSLILFFSVRYVVILLCIILSPFAFLCLSNNIYMFKVWIKIFCFNLIVQILNKLIIFIPVVSQDEKDIYSCILIGSVLVMYKIAKLVGEFKIYGKNK